MTQELMLYRDAMRDRFHWQLILSSAAVCQELITMGKAMASFQQSLVSAVIAWATPDIANLAKEIMLKELRPAGLCSDCGFFFDRGPYLQRRIREHLSHHQMQWLGGFTSEPPDATFIPLWQGGAKVPDSITVDGKVVAVPHYFASECVKYRTTLSNAMQESFQRGDWFRYEAARETFRMFAGGHVPAWDRGFTRKDVESNKGHYQAARSCQ